MTGPLSGVRVLDLTHIIAGPFCTLLLADAGAEIVKVEPPAGGETSRHQGPFLNGLDGSAVSAYFMRLNRNKKSITLNLKERQGAAFFKRLTATYDVVVENFTPGVMDRLGLSYKDLSEINPRLVYASLSGYGQPTVMPSPYSALPAMAVAIEAFSGLMSLSGGAGNPPSVIGFPVGDIFAGALTAFGIVSAVYEARASGSGQYVDVAMFDASLAMNEKAITHYSLSKEVLSRDSETMIAPLGAYPTLDGYVSIAAAIEKTWNKFCNAIERPDLRSDPRFKTGRDRAIHQNDLRPEIEAWTKIRTSADVASRLLEYGVPAAPVRNVAEVFHDKGVEARQMLVEVADPQLGPVRLIGSPVKFSHSLSLKSAPPPSLGQDNLALLKEELQIPDDEYASLSEQQVILGRRPCPACYTRKSLSEHSFAQKADWSDRKIS